MELFANNASTTLASSYTPGSGTITVAGATPYGSSYGEFPIPGTGQFFRVKCAQLIWKVTSVNTTTQVWAVTVVESSDASQGVNTAVVAELTAASVASLTQSGFIANADIATTAAIAQSKLALDADPGAHGARHGASGADVLPWATILGAGNDASKPAAATTNAGYIWIAADTEKIYQSTGTAWTQVFLVVPTFTNPMTAPDDIIVGGAAGAPTRLAGPGNNKVLAASAGAPIWLPHLHSIADVPPASPSTWDDEFNGTSLNAKWTLATTGGSPSAYTSDIDTAWPSFYTVRRTGDCNLRLIQSFVPGSSAFSITAKFSASLKDNYESVRINLFDTTSFQNGVALILEHSTPSEPALNAQFSTISAGTYTYNVFQAPAAYGGTFYLHTERTAANVYSFWFSYNGLSWTYIGGGTYTFTVGVMYIEMGASSATATDPRRYGIDYIRFNSLTI